MAKSTALRKEVMLRIAKKKERYPDTPNRMLADEFGVTLRQVNYAVNLYKKDQLEVKKTISKAKKRKLLLEVESEIIAEQKKKTSKEILKETFENLTLLISADTEMVTSVKMGYLKDLVAISKQILAVDLSAQIKDPDADRIALLVRLIKPETTDEFIIELWKKACELYKLD